MPSRPQILSNQLQIRAKWQKRQHERTVRPNNTDSTIHINTEIDFVEYNRMLFRISKVNIVHLHYRARQFRHFREFQLD